jgi:hypothetical protein
VKILYFDISGTLVDDGGRAKPALADGAFERAVRAAGVERLVCVSSLLTIVEARRMAGQDIDPHGFILGQCGGVFSDEAWFRGTVLMETVPRRRVEAIDESLDWYYVDDYAREYLEHAGRYDLEREEIGRRVLVTPADSDGRDVLDWLEGVVAG